MVQDPSPFPHMLPIEFHFEAGLNFLILAYNQYPPVTTIQITGGYLNYWNDWADSSDWLNTWPHRKPSKLKKQCFFFGWS